MRQIQMKSVLGVDRLDLADISNGTFYEGQTKPLTDEKAKIALSNPNFIDAKLGYNPNFACKMCGQRTLDRGFYRGKSVLDEEGKPTCIDCMIKGVSQTAVEVNQEPAAAPGEQENEPDVKEETN